MFAGFDFPFLLTKGIPDGWPAPVAVNGSFDLVGGRGGSPNEVGAEMGTGQRRDWWLSRGKDTWFRQNRFSRDSIRNELTTPSGLFVTKP